MSLVQASGHQVGSAEALLARAPAWQVSGLTRWWVMSIHQNERHKSEAGDVHVGPKLICPNGFLKHKIKQSRYPGSPQGRTDCVQAHLFLQDLP